MTRLDQTTLGQQLPTGPQLLELERRARATGTGLSAATLQGAWQLERLWSRAGVPSGLAAGLLRGLAARLEIVASEHGLALRNAVTLAGLELRFLGEAELRGRRPLLLFRFDTLELSLAGRVLLRRTLPPPDPRRQPFFALIARGGAPEDDAPEDDAAAAAAVWLAARGRGGGLALWRQQAVAGSRAASAQSP